MSTENFTTGYNNAHKTESLESKTSRFCATQCKVKDTNLKSGIPRILIKRQSWSRIEPPPISPTVPSLLAKLFHHLPSIHLHISIGYKKIIMENTANMVKIPRRTLVFSPLDCSEAKASSPFQLQTRPKVGSIIFPQNRIPRNESKSKITTRTNESMKEEVSSRTWSRCIKWRTQHLAFRRHDRGRSWAGAWPPSLDNRCRSRERSEQTPVIIQKPYPWSCGREVEIRKLTTPWSIEFMNTPIGVDFISLITIVLYISIFELPDPQQTPPSDWSRANASGQRESRAWTSLEPGHETIWSPDSPGWCTRLLQVPCNTYLVELKGTRLLETPEI